MHNAQGHLRLRLLLHFNFMLSLRIENGRVCLLVMNTFISERCALSKTCWQNDSSICIRWNIKYILGDSSNNYLCAASVEKNRINTQTHRTLCDRLNGDILLETRAVVVDKHLKIIRNNKQISRYKSNMPQSLTFKTIEITL